MSNPFVAVELTTSESQLASEAIAKLVEEMEKRGYIGWTYSEADLEIILIGVVAGMAAVAAQVASVVPEAIFRQYGTELLKVTFNEGAAATATTTWTIVPVVGKREIPAGTQIVGQGASISTGGLGFYVETNTEVPSGESSVNVPVVALERGTEYNGVEGVAEQVNPIDFVTEVKFIGITSGGVNQEEDKEYLNRLSSLLQLQAPRPITAANFAEFVLDAPSTIVPSGVEVGRATAIDGYNPETHKFEGTVTSGSTTMTEVTSFAGISKESTTLPQVHPGTRLEGSGIPKGTTVVSVNEGAKTLVMSNKATSTPGKLTIEAIGSYENQRTVTVFVTNTEGKALSNTAMTDIAEYLKSYRELNFLIFVEAATYNEIQITGQVHVLPGYTPASVIMNVEVALEQYLSPKTWGNQQIATGGSSWLNATQQNNIVRYNSIIGVMESVQGVQYVPSGSAGLSIGLNEAPGSKTADLILLGPAPLPELKPAGVLIASV